MQTTIQVEPMGVMKASDGQWSLRLCMPGEEGVIVEMLGGDSDLTQFTKLLKKKSVDARLSIGAEEDVAGDDQVKAELEAARGALTVIYEKAQVYSTSTKGSADQARYMELLREARDGLTKIGELVPAPKKNGGAHPEQPAPAAS